MTVDLEILGAWIATIMAISGPIFMLVRNIAKLLTRLSNLEAWTRKQQEDIEHSKVERRIILTGTLACLEGLYEQGCNGAVSKSIKEIQEFLLEEAHKGKSEESIRK